MTMKKNTKQPDKRTNNHTQGYRVEFHNQFLPKLSSCDPKGAISTFPKECDPKFWFFSSRSVILLWRYFNSVSRHSSLDNGNSFALKYTAESEFRRLLSTLLIVTPPKSSRIKINNGNFKTYIISKINLTSNGRTINKQKEQIKTLVKLLKNGASILFRTCKIKGGKVDNLFGEQPQIH